jgi:hypothetical protein
MTAFDRRNVLRVMLGGAVVATAGLALIPVPAESAPLAMSKGLSAATENGVEEAVVVVRRRRHWGRRRRVRVRSCWWHRGRRVCRWRWVWR